MRQININSGRVVQRRVSEGEYLLGLIHLDQHQPIEEGADYLLMVQNQHMELVELPSTSTSTSWLATLAANNAPSPM